jgi:hypothetical protein
MGGVDAVTPSVLATCLSVVCNALLSTVFCRNQAAALAAVQAAAQAGQQPQLKALLVEPSWQQVRPASAVTSYVLSSS